MQKQVFGKVRATTLCPTFALMCTMLLTPLLGSLYKTEAGPRRHVPAYGYRSRTRVWSSNPSRWRFSSSRRYRTRYRTTYDRFGRPHRTYYRVYY